MPKREEWSRVGFILAAIGSAVGLGNIWRFPYLVGKSGGGAFFIPYLLGIVLLAFPVLLFELAIGRHFKKGVISTFARINRKWKHLGLVLVGTCFLILSYYLVVAGWTLAYGIFSLEGHYQLFPEFISSFNSVCFFIVLALMTAGIVLKGVKKGIERTAKTLMPLLFVFLGIMLVRALTLPGFLEGLKFYLTPHFDKLVNPKIWIAGFGQALFSLSVGQGVMLTYGSYLNKRQDIPKSTFWIILADTLVAFVSGLIIFPIVFSFGFNPAAGPQLAFVTLPKIFETMPFGYLLGAIFFFLLFIGALTSAISILEVPVAGVIEEFKLKRKKATLLVLAALIPIGLLSALSYSQANLSVLGKPILDILDHFAGSLLVILSTLVLCLYISRHRLLDNLVKEIDKSARIKIPKFFEWVFHVFVPAVLIIILVYQLV